MTTPNLQLAEPPDASISIAAELRDTFRALDATGPGVIAVLSDTTTSPPGGALQGARYLVPESATGDWLGHARHVAYLTPEGWRFRVPRRGWVALVLDLAALGILKIYDGTEWQPFAFDALDISFDGYAAGLDATNVDAALEELATTLGIAVIELADHELRITDLEAGGGGGSGGGNVTPDTHPISVPAANDEFETGSTIDTAGTRFSGATAWTAFGSTTGADIQQGALLFKPLLTGSRNMGGYTQPVSGSWAYTCKILAVAPGSALIGMMIATASGTSGNIIAFGFNLGFSDTVVQRLSNISTFSANAFIGLGPDVDQITGEPTPYYLRISYDGTTFRFSLSPSGYDQTFVQLYSETSAGFLGTPTLIGIAGDNESASVQSYAMIDWFRKTA